MTLSVRQVQLLIHIHENPLVTSVAHHHLRTWKSLVDRGAVAVRGSRAVLTRRGKALHAQWLDHRSRERLFVKGYTPNRPAAFKSYEESFNPEVLRQAA